MDPNETEEQDVFSFVYDKKNRKKNQSPSKSNLISNEKSSKTSNEKSQDPLNKSNEIFTLSTKKKPSSSKQKKKLTKNKGKNEYKLDILDEEIEYLFNLLKDGNANAITEITLRKALNNARMTNIDDETVKVNIFLYRYIIYICK